MGHVSGEGTLFLKEFEDLLVEGVLAGLDSLVDLFNGGFREDCFDIVLVGD